MKIKIVAVGKTRAKPWRLAEEDFFNRIKNYIAIEQAVVKEASAKSLRNDMLVKKREAEDILKKTSRADFLVALDSSGKQLRSEDLAERISKWSLRGIKQVTFILGGPLGLGEAVLKKADLCLALSKMTFPHEMAKVILLEQIYRAFTILKGEKYHK